MTLSGRDDWARAFRDRIGRAVQRALRRTSCLLIGWFLVVALVNWAGLCQPLAERLAAYAHSRGADLQYAGVRLSPAGALVLEDVEVTAAGEHFLARTVAAGPAPWRAWLHGAPLGITLTGLEGRASAAGAALVAKAAPATKAAPANSGEASPAAAHWSLPIAVAWREATLDGLPGGPVTADGLAIWRPSDVRVLVVRAGRDDAHLTFTGDFGLRARGAGQLHLTGLDLGRDLGFPARWRTDGDARFSGRVTGTFSDPEIAGEAQIAHGRIWGVPLATANGAIEMNRSAFRFSQASATAPGAPGGRLDGEGRLDLGGDGGLEVHLGVHEVPVSDLAGALNLQGKVGGRAAGELTLEGPYGKIHVDGELSMARFGLGQTVIEQVAGKIDWQPDESGGRLALNDMRVVQADGNGGRLHFDGRIDENGDALVIAGELGAADVKLGPVRIHSLAGPLRIGDGEIRLDAALDGGEAKDVLGLESGLATLFGGRLTGRLHVRGALAEPEARLELGWGSAWGQTAGVHLDLRLDRNGLHVG